MAKGGTTDQARKVSKCPSKTQPYFHRYIISLSSYLDITRQPLNYKFNMSNHQSNIENPTEVNVPAVEGHMNALFEEPSNKTGANATAVCSQQDPLYRIGTAPRVQFDKKNKMIVQVKFKIHAEKEVEVDNPPAIKVQGRKAAPALVVRYNLIELKMFNSGNVIELVKCFFGKSFNDFKGMCGDICEQYEPGMRHMVLNSKMAPRLRWMGQVGREKVFLVDYPTWQTFVDLLAKATKHKGSVTIFTENEKEKARKVAQTCAAKELIASASGPTAAEAHVGVLTKELEDAHKRIALHELTAKLFHDQSQNGTSGDGAVLVRPWDPSFLYRSTWHGAWVWAKGIYLAIMKKSRVFHKATQVNDRVKMQSSQLQVNLSPTFHKSGASCHSFFESPARLLFQKPSGSKRGGSLEGGMPSESDKKKVKIEPASPSKFSKGFTIVISSDPPSPIKNELSPKDKFQIKQEAVLPSNLGKPLTVVLSSDHELPTEIAFPEDSKKINKNEAAYLGMAKLLSRLPLLAPMLRTVLNPTPAL
ncbi:uncharacterized protein MELLADRAFT_95489 [Melampsora larici-populina 98AG31]|uniref:Uncharacterized protein n=1 Tax=Melampsora larici-populina (strain 98AG31 / pathotype 3-4-7) TaxID=747676 RepID=F4S9I5_MELLP|nr:uncharacterized protein MELLADRAFT_95489 [Melampsora larici-populina 98AG31]EGF98695.1 hypothetical protein MELLADRAFT_95489 [Melampsora larici-populina 98AG31]